MKRIIVKISLICFLALMINVGFHFLTAPSLSFAAEKVTKIKLACFTPPAEMWRTKHFTGLVERMSGGRIQFQIFAGGELVPTTELLSACATGVTDMAMSVGLYHQSKVPIAAIESGMPFQWQQKLIDKGVLFDERGLLDLVRKEYSEKGGVYYVGYFASDPYQLITTKPARNLEELRKLKIRTTGDMGKVLQKAGIPTVFVPGEEMYTALSTGVIDGVIWGGASGYMDYKMFEIAKYFYYPAFSTSVTLNMFANKKFWNNLPDDLKAIFEVAVREMNLWIAVNFHDLDIKALAKAKAMGVKVITLPEEDMQILRKSALSLWEENATKSPGSKKAIEILKQYHRDAGYLD